MLKFLELVNSYSEDIMEIVNPNSGSVISTSIFPSEREKWCPDNSLADHVYTIIESI